MIDFRGQKQIDLNNAVCLREKSTFKYVDSVTHKNLVSKFLVNYPDENDEILISEFKKLVTLSGEPEIASVYFLADGVIGSNTQSCYIMEFVDGKNLNEFLDARPTIIYEVAYNLISQLASALEKAHRYEIYHNDLNSENIIITPSGYIKLIDFGWWDIKSKDEKESETDLKCFKERVKEIESKCKENDSHRLSFIVNYSLGISVFNNLSKELEMLDQISFDLSLIPQKATQILGVLFHLTGDFYQLDLAITINDHDIPETLISPLDDKEKSYINALNPGLLKPMDTRITRIKTDLHNILFYKLSPLEQTGLINWDVWITNDGQDFIGPYKLNCQISFTSKYFKWKKKHELLGIINHENIELENLLLE